jgi:simple sugar transport system permease protein
MKKLGYLFIVNRDTNLLRLLIIAASIFIIMSFLNPRKFLTILNLTSMSYQFPEFGLLAIGMMISLIAGGIDLSVVGIANLSGILAALIMTNLISESTSNSNIIIIIFIAIFTILFVGITCGLFNGFLIAKFKIPPILATLGTMQLFMGISVVITKGPAVLGFPEQFLFIGNGKISIFPMPLVIFIVFASLIWMMFKKTPFGLKLFMMGTNPTASLFSGINNTVILIKTYMIIGFLAGVAGIIIIARTNCAKADYGTSYILQSILIAILGGVNPAGGFGTIFGLIIAILSLQFLSTGFNMLRFSNHFKDFSWGMLLLVVMVINYIGNKYKSKQT